MISPSRPNSTRASAVGWGGSRFGAARSPRPSAPATTLLRQSHEPSGNRFHNNAASRANKRSISLLAGDFKNSARESIDNRPECRCEWAAPVVAMIRLLVRGDRRCATGRRAADEPRSRMAAKRPETDRSANAKHRHLQLRFRGVAIQPTRKEFGLQQSREHAKWRSPSATSARRRVAAQPERDRQHLLLAPRRLTRSAELRSRDVSVLSDLGRIAPAGQRYSSQSSRRAGNPSNVESAHESPRLSMRSATSASTQKAQSG